MPEPDEKPIESDWVLSLEPSVLLLQVKEALGSHEASL